MASFMEHSDGLVYQSYTDGTVYFTTTSSGSSTSGIRLNPGETFHYEGNTVKNVSDTLKHIYHDANQYKAYTQKPLTPVEKLFQLVDEVIAYGRIDPYRSPEQSFL